MISIILSGGSGTRLWPVSRTMMPKQFCHFLEETLYTKALKRVLPLGPTFTVTTQALRTLTLNTVKAFNIPEEQVIFEPDIRNTAPAIALACHILQMQGHEKDVAGVFPADQLIENDDGFRAAIRYAETLAKQDQIVTLGVVPTFPATGYGYIETQQVKYTSGEFKALVASGFREKPNLDTAEQFLAEGRYYWNSGMFVFRVGHMIELLKTHAPDVWKSISQIKPDLSNVAECYQKSPNISIDFAVMEKLKEHICIPFQYEWSDVGSWDAIANILPSEKTNSQKYDTGENYVHALPGKSYALVGVDDLIIADTADALLIVKKGESEKVKGAVDYFKKLGSNSVKEHVYEERPWGTYEVLRDKKSFKLKTISVNAHSQLSYQSHTKRMEHWIIVEGTGEVVLNDEIVKVKPGSYIHIPTGAKHRMRNTGDQKLTFVEVQLGSYFGEDDIIRYQDDYKRV